MQTQVDGRGWKQLYRAAFLNPRSSDLSDRIATAESAIITRARELLRNRGGNMDELDELDEALYMLRAWKTSQALGRRMAA